MIDTSENGSKYVKVRRTIGMRARIIFCLASGSSLEAHGVSLDLRTLGYITSLCHLYTEVE